MFVASATTQGGPRKADNVVCTCDLVLRAGQGLLPTPEETSPPRLAAAPPPGDAPKENLRERICQRLLAMDPILFMVGVLLLICGAVVGLWDTMGLVLPL